MVRRTEVSQTTKGGWVGVGAGMLTGSRLEPPAGCCCLPACLPAGGCWGQLRAASTQLCTVDAQTTVTTGSRGYNIFPNFGGGVDIRRVRRWVAAEMFELLVSTGCARLCFTAKHAQTSDYFVLEALLMDVVISFTQSWKGRGEVLAGSAKLLSH